MSIKEAMFEDEHVLDLSKEEILFNDVSIFSLWTSFI
jgi:hypothetical protein